MHQSLVKMILIHICTYMYTVIIVGMYMCSIAIVHYCTARHHYALCYKCNNHNDPTVVWGAHAHGGWTGA